MSKIIDTLWIKDLYVLFVKDTLWSCLCCLYTDITIICSVITFHNTFGLQRDEDDGWCMELQILLITHQCVHQLDKKNWIFCRNRPHHGGFVKTGFFQKTASSQEKTELFPELFITWHSRQTPFKRGFKPCFLQKQASYSLKLPVSGRDFFRVIFMELQTRQFLSTIPWSGSPTAQLVSAQLCHAGY